MGSSCSVAASLAPGWRDLPLNTPSVDDVLLPAPQPAAVGPTGRVTSDAREAAQAGQGGVNPASLFIQGYAPRDL